MRPARLLFCVWLVFFFSCGYLAAQQTAVSASPTPPQRDPQALAILALSLKAAGGSPAITAIQDYSAEGNVTFNWAGKEVEGTVTVKGAGADQFRMDSIVPDGTQSWVVNRLSGTLLTPDGKTFSLAPYDLINAGSLTVPAVRIAAVTNDSTTSIIYMGQVSVGGRQAYQIRFIPTVDASLSTIPGLNEVGTLDLFIDGSNLQPFEELETLHDQRNTVQTYTQQISFANFHEVNGVLVPFSVAQNFAGQAIWSVNLNSISFNTGLSDSDFGTTNSQ